jgi:hypothetical protein
MNGPQKGPKTYMPMTWKGITSLVGRKIDDRAKAKQQAILSLFRTYDARVQADLSVAMPGELADRLDRFIAAVPGITKRNVVLTGVELFLEACESNPGLAPQMLKDVGFESRGKVSLCSKIPLALDERLARFVAVHGSISRRAAAAAGMNLLLSKCEELNGGPFVAPGLSEVER